jgi:gliding motility-associated-like protein
MKLRKYVTGLLCWGCFCTLSAQTVAVRPGAIQVKLTPETEQHLYSVATPLTATGTPLQVGIKPLDVVHTTYKASKMQPIFRVGGKYEERQRKHGLHLWYEITIDEQADLHSAAADYLRTGIVEIAEPAYAIRHIGAVPVPDSLKVAMPNTIVPATSSDDPRYNQQWHYHNTGQTPGGRAGIDIRLPEAWETSKGDPKVIVSVVDGGIAYTHEDLAGNMWPGIGYNFINGSSGVVTAEDHGTHVAGTIAARSNNATGVAGIAGGWGTAKGVQLMSCQIFNDDEESTANTPDAIRYGADNGAVISQNSWGYKNAGVNNTAVRAAISYFITYAGTNQEGNALPGTPMKGGIVIFAAGNDGSDRADWYPGMWPEVLCVAAVAPTGQRASYSNYSEAVDISAPGGDATISSNSQVLSTTTTGYGWMQGTSMACPHVSGVAALVLSHFGSETYTPAMLRDRLILSANPLPDDNFPYLEGKMGTGLIDASKAVAPFIHATGVNLPPIAEGYVNRATTIAATLIPDNATDYRITWSSSHPAVATIDATKGIITGVSAGTTTITATTNDGGHTATSILTVVPVHVERISVSPKIAQMIAGDQQQLSTIIYPTDAANKDVVWSSINPTVASVSQEGVVTAMSNGSTTITVTTVDGGFSDSSIVYVRTPVSGVRVDPNDVRILVGDTMTLIPLILPDGAESSVSWKSSNSGVVTVNNTTGKIKGVKSGEAKISVTTDEGGFTVSCKVSVYDAARAPEGFSPNGDGINDYFVCTLDNRDTYTLVVFDRSGQVHYRSSDYRNDWNGEANTGPHAGNKVPVNTYFHTLSAKNSGQVIKGFVVIKY